MSTETAHPSTPASDEQAAVPEEQAVKEPTEQADEQAVAEVTEQPAAEQDEPEPASPEAVYAEPAMAEPETTEPAAEADAPAAEAATEPPAEAEAPAVQAATEPSAEVETPVSEDQQPEAATAAVEEPVADAAPERPAPAPRPTVSDEMMDMGALLEQAEAAQLGSVRRGEIVEGMVLGASSDGLLVDIGTKTEAIVPHNEMLSLGAEGASSLSAGDEIRVMVLRPAGQEGHALVSIDRARGEEGWRVLAERLESGEIFEAEITGYNRGGVLANVEGVNAFIPLSQIDSIRRDDPEAVANLPELVGKPVRLKVIELNRKRNRVILSERAAMAEWRKDQKERIIDELAEGDIRDGRVSSITDFGVFVDLGGADGLAHMTELTWERGKRPKDLFSVGDPVKAYVLKVDTENQKISLSIKRAQPEEWDNIVNRYVVGQILVGRVTKLMSFGAFVKLDGPVEGLIHISELSTRRIQHPREVVKEGDVVPVKLVRVERDRHRLGLSLRKARPDAEAMGFYFDHMGHVVDYPEDVKREFGIEISAEESAALRAPRSAQEAISDAIARDPEPVSAFAHAFAQALEHAESEVEFPEGSDPA